MTPKTSILAVVAAALLAGAGFGLYQLGLQLGLNAAPTRPLHLPPPQQVPTRKAASLPAKPPPAGTSKPA